MKMNGLWSLTTREQVLRRMSETLPALIKTCQTMALDHYTPNDEIDEKKVSLVGYLCASVFLVKKQGHSGLAADIQELLDVVLSADLASGDGRKAVLKKHSETNPFSAQIGPLDLVVA